MLTVTIQIDAPLGLAGGVKEDLAMYCERFGDAKVISVTEQKPRQVKMDGFGGETKSR